MDQKELRNSFEKCSGFSQDPEILKNSWDQRAWSIWEELEKSFHSSFVL